MLPDESRTSRINVIEDKFMEKYLELVVNPDLNIRAYLNAKWMLKGFILLCFVVDICLQFTIYSEYIKPVENINTKERLQKYNSNFIFIAINFTVSLISTCYGLKTLSANY